MNELEKYLDEYLSFYTPDHSRAARALSARFGSLGAISSASEKELQAVDGVDATVVHALKLAAYLYGRSVVDSYKLPCTVGEEQIKQLLLAIYSGVSCESVYCLLFDKRNRLAAIEFLGDGISNYSEIYPRRVLDAATAVRAEALIIAHNHPHGVAEPSVADLNGTLRLKSVLCGAGIRFLGHYIVADTVCEKIKDI